MSKDNQKQNLSELCEEYRRYNGFNSADYQTYNVKRGLYGSYGRTY